MFENTCRICAKGSQEGEDINLFDRKNRKLLLQLKDLTGVLLKNNIGLPKSLCSVCHNALQEAYKFREDFLKVQASFNVKILKPSKKKKDSNGLIEATEFVQMFVVKEEKDIQHSDHEQSEHEDEEKEINLNEEVPYKKDSTFDNIYKNEINALELKPNEENTLEDPKIPIQDEQIEEEGEDEKHDNHFDDSKTFSDFEEEDDHFLDSFIDKGSDAEFVPSTTSLKKSRTSPKKKREPKTKSKDDKTNTNDEPVTETNIPKPRKKRKDAEDQPSIYICDQCGNHFTCRHHFKLHLRRHTGDKQCACELCPDKFFTSSELRRHMRKHTGERPFACKFCDRRFTDYSTRIKHERTHTNERPFMCSQCGKSFTTSYILKNHMLTHTGERHFKCDVCNKAFTRRTHLVVHFRSIMHKQAVEKDKQPLSSQELLQPPPRLLPPPPTKIPSFLV